MIQSQDIRSSVKLSLRVAFLILVVFAIYANAFGNQFLFDDEFLIVKNSFLRQWGNAFAIFSASSTTGAGGVDSFYRPLQTLAYLFIFQVFGLSTFGFHLLNISIHAANAVLILLLGRSLKFRDWPVFTAALIWAVHPMHTEAVVYMSATADGLYTLFCLVGIYALLPNFSYSRVAFATLIFALALMSKESAIVFPALAVLLRWLTADPGQRYKFRTYAFTLSFWLLAICYLVARKTVLNFDHTFEFYRQANLYTQNFHVRVFTFLATLPSYLGVMLWPTGLHMERNFPVYTSFLYWPVWLGSLLLAASLIPIGMNRARRSAALAFGIIWFWAAHSPHTGVLIPVNSFFLEHWMYLASAGLFLGFAETAWRSSFSGWLTLLAIPLAVLTYKQNEVWATPVSFYTNIIRYNPSAARAHNNLAMAYTDLGENDRAMTHYLRAIEITDAYPQTHYNLALLLLGRQKTSEAVAHLKRAVEINPDFYYAYGTLHDLALSRGDRAEADDWARKYQDARKRMGF